MPVVTLRVLHLYRPELPSTRAQSIQVLHTCHALASLGCHVTLLANPPAHHPWPGAPAALRRFGLEPHPRLALLCAPSGPQALRSAWFRAQLLVWLASAGPKVVLARSKRYADALMRLPGCPPLVLEAHELDSELCVERGEDPAPMLALEGRVLRRAAALICNGSGTLALHLQRHTKDSPALRRVVMNATSPSRRVPRRPTAAPTLGYCGSLRAFKDVGLLVELARALPPGVTVELLGGSEVERGALGQVPDALKVLGERDYVNTPEVCRRWHAALLPLRDDLFGRMLCNPLKGWEYRALGLPVVAADLPSLREALSPQATRWYAPGDISSLHQATLQVLRAPPACAPELRSWADRAAELLPILQRVAG